MVRGEVCGMSTTNQLAVPTLVLTPASAPDPKSKYRPKVVKEATNMTPMAPMLARYLWWGEDSWRKAI